nr:hypothetical protein GCM10025732_01710 [Glycomyces mayteni]
MDTMSSYGAPTAPLSPPRARPEADPESLLQGIERLTGFSEIDRGAYSTVFSATRFDDGAEVAVKIEARPLTDDASRERFRHEVQTAGRLSDHPCVVKMLSAGLTHQANPYVVMERCRGSVADLLDRHTTIPRTARSRSASASPTRSPRPTRPGSSTATSSPRTSSSTTTATPCSPTSGSPASSPSPAPGSGSR